MASVLTSYDGPANDHVDWTSCDREPIHVPGAIQPHGLLFALTGPGLQITAVSANVSTHLGHDPLHLLGMSLASVTNDASFESVVSSLRGDVSLTRRMDGVRFNVQSDKAWRGFVHRTPDGALLEAELPRPQSDAVGSAADLFERFEQAARRVQVADTVQEICGRLAQEVRRLTGFDRVKIYRFAPNWNGEVVAEDNGGNLPSYLGLHFPASDIPIQARALYGRNPERLIPDSEYTPVALLQVAPEPIDLSQAMLRSVSPTHCAYLHNMRVGASMSVSILCRGELWGLVACHHRSAHYLSLELRQASVLLAQLAAGQLTLVEELTAMRRSVDAKAVAARLLDGSSGAQLEALACHGPDLLRVMGASGLVVQRGNEVTTIGQTPRDPELSALLAWLADSTPELFETDHLASHFQGRTQTPEAAGILAVKLGGLPQNLMVWLRPEFARTVTWAGNPEKPADNDRRDLRLTPRRSFAAWQEEVKGRSRPWARHELMAANLLRDAIVNLLLRHSLDLERSNAELSRSNEDLEAFAHVASHDLREPLRQIETFGSLLERAFKERKLTDSPGGDKVMRWFDGIQASSQRLQRLIDELANYAKIGLQARPFAPNDLGRILQQVCDDFSGAIESAGAVIHAAALPVVVCDGIQMRQVLQNLMSNALKYRHPDRQPIITINARAGPPAGEAGLAALPVLEIGFEDNGIGFENHHNERIFEPFQRLHSSDLYEGSGIGLAICRKVLARHDGSISAEGRPGQGAIFILSLPIRPLNDEGSNK